MPEEDKKKKKRTALATLAIFFGFVLPVSVLIIGITIFRVNDIGLKPSSSENIQETSSEGVLKPSELLSNRAKHAGKRVVVQGRVSREPAVCEKKECPSDNPCCGCPEERSLILNDSNVVLTSNSGGRLRLLDQEKKPFCFLPAGSCNYECSGWEEGAIYDVTGNFFTETPPPGWKISLEYYFLVENKSLVKSVGILDTIGNLFNEIKAQFYKLKTSGSYVL